MINAGKDISVRKNFACFCVVLKSFYCLFIELNDKENDIYIVFHNDRTNDDNN